MDMQTALTENPQPQGPPQPQGTHQRGLPVSEQTPAALRLPPLRGAAIAAIALLVAGGWAGPGCTAPGRCPAMLTPTLGVAAPLQAPVVQWDDYVGRFAPSQSVDVRPRVAARSPRGTSAMATSCKRASFSSPSTSAPIAPRWPRRGQCRLGAQRAGAGAFDLARAAAFRATRRFRQARSIAARPPSGRRSRAGRRPGPRTRPRAGYGIHPGARAHLGPHFGSAGRCGQSGRSGEGANATLLTTINALDPIYFTFDSSEALFLKAQRDRAAGHASAEVEIKLQDEPDYRHHGASISPTTGSTRIRARSAAARCWPTPACS
jgi:hypothetical protein